MIIEAKEYLQVGYKPELFENVVNLYGYKMNKTAVDPYPTHSKYWQPQVMQKHHIYVESFINFARYIPNKYEIIHFTFTPTEYEYRLAERLLEKDGQIIFA